MRAAGSGQRGRRQLSGAQRGTVQAFIAVANLDHFDDDLLAAARAGEDCRFVVALTAQAALRDAIGRASVSNVVMRRHQLDQELQEAVEAKVTDWGITVLSVEIRDIIIPKELQGVMSLEAQAECRKNARIALMEAERDVSAILQEVAETYSHDDIALSLRKMHLTYEGMQDNGSSLVVPSAYSEGFAKEPGKEASER